MALRVFIPTTLGATDVVLGGESEFAIHGPGRRLGSGLVEEPEKNVAEGGQRVATQELLDTGSWTTSLSLCFTTSIRN